MSSKEVIEKVQIYNLLGQNVTTKINLLKQPEVKVNTASFNKGIYIVRVKNSNGSFTKKININ
ncbi:T9SS type A sorting domain-containing protein [Polaribacter atrinae]|uniref:T9SS type A sorting domain-containing protein n=1 Tax=Polaribacter atrinae TaxID=1333662 RepID=UPI003BF47AD0